MWLQVCFDLPVLSDYERKSATSFRNLLLDNGFEMAQYSVYLRVCSCKEMAEKFIKIIQQNLPESGTISTLMFTDKQYENMKVFVGKKLEKIEQKSLFFEEF